MRNLAVTFRFLALLAAIAAVSCAVPRTAAAQDTLEVSKARIRWLPGELPLAGYMELHNTGARRRVLTGAACDWFGKVMIHESVTEDGQSHMLMREQVVIAPGATLSFAPGGLHLMLMARQKPVQVGERIPVTLQFADGSEQTVTFAVQGATTS